MLKSAPWSCLLAIAYLFIFYEWIYFAAVPKANAGQTVALCGPAAAASTGRLRGGEREQVVAAWAASGACWATRRGHSSHSTRPPSLSGTRPRSPFSTVADEGTCGTRPSGSLVRAHRLQLPQAGTPAAATCYRKEARCTGKTDCCVVVQILYSACQGAD